MIILVINCGSSSIKYQLLDMKSDDVYEVIAKGIAENIGLEAANLQYTPKGGHKMVSQVHIPDHKAGMRMVLEAIVDPEIGVLKSFDDIEAVGHRIVQGADFFSGSVIVDEDVKEKIRICCDFAPLHNAAHLLGIEACAEVLPSVPQVVVFDTAFHQTMPDYAYLYGIPYDAYKDHKIRKYGFHGTSHRYITMQIENKLGRKDLRIITCHLGNGSSLAAVKDGKCIDTTMGLTPLEGLVMGTRSGDIDPTAVTYIMKKYDILDKKVKGKVSLHSLRHTFATL